MLGGPVYVQSAAVINFPMFALRSLPPPPSPVWRGSARSLEPKEPGSFPRLRLHFLLPSTFPLGSPVSVALAFRFQKPFYMQIGSRLLPPRFLASLCTSPIYPLPPALPLRPLAPCPSLWPATPYPSTPTLPFPPHYLLLPIDTEREDPRCRTPAEAGP